MRRAAKVDANQKLIVGALRACGASVQSIAAAGDGVPDLLVGWRGRNLLLEVKDGSKVPSKRQLTPDQVEWHGAWRGQVCVVHSVEQALALVAKRCDACEMPVFNADCPGCESRAMGVMW